MKVTFFERLGAYLLDALIISFIFYIICLDFGNNANNSKKIMEELDNNLLNGLITTEEYIEQYKDVLYDNQKSNALQSGISVALTIAYYVVFQYMNKGQTIGKKLLKIKVVDKDTKEPISILKGLLRSFIILSILSGTLCILLLYILNRNNYFIGYSLILFLEGIFTLTSIILVLYRKDGRGLHDMMANTIVVKESR